MLQIDGSDGARFSNNNTYTVNFALNQPVA